MTLGKFKTSLKTKYRCELGNILSEIFSHKRILKPETNKLQDLKFAFDREFDHDDENAMDFIKINILNFSKFLN